ncbi:MAG: BREX-1 system phosphatase PglZ type B [Dehalococcoidia bacterium]|nr:BREX-1 system phosphatase PglZ type B [Dehalococcoidia bacterium]
MTTFLDALVRTVERAGRYNAAEYARPAAILWPDGGREWEPLLPLLRERLPLLTLGSYEPTARVGPAHWLLCMLARTLEDKIPEDELPVIYMPGVSKQDLRAVEDCPAHLQPIASLQYEGVLFTQLNGKDWTIRAFIESADGGLGVAFEGNGATKSAAQRALLKLAAVPVARMKSEAPLRAPFFDDLLNPDQARSVLEWLDDPDGYQKRCTAEEWGAFQSVCQTKYGFRPDKDGPLAGGQRLGERLEPAWEVVWARFAESPASFPRIPDLLRRARPTKDAGMFARLDSWPQDNEAAEARLRDRLLEIGSLMPDEARAAILELDDQRSHGQRRQWVWAKLGHAPLAMALSPLAELARSTRHALTGSSVRHVAETYAQNGWHADNAALLALGAVDQPADVAAVTAAVLAIYRPWLEESAKRFQSLAGDGGASTYEVVPLSVQEPGTCLLFVDGLRMDVAHRLSGRLAARGLAASVDWRITALPTITATAKPAVTPVGPSLRGGPELSPSTISGSKVDITVLRKLLREADIQVLGPSDLLGDPNGLAWAEAGDLDETGHTRGVGLARQVDQLVADVEARIVGLVDEGWRRVVVVTDHGFLLLPGGLPKVELPLHLADIRKGRCARMKTSSIPEQQTVPWHWDGAVRFAVAPGIACFEAGKEYEHGGLSPQECVTPVLEVTRRDSELPINAAIGSITWNGLRCRVSVTGAEAGWQADLRREPASGESSVTSGPKALDDEGKASLLVVDERLEGEPVHLVVISSSGIPVLQQQTVVGGAN